MRWVVRTWQEKDSAGHDYIEVTFGLSAQLGGVQTLGISADLAY